MPQHQQKRKYAVPPEEVVPVLDQALSSAGASVAERDDGEGWRRAHVSMGFLSWGEVVEVTARAAPDGGSEVSVKSKSRFPLTLIDYGKNKKNVEAVFQHLDAALARADSPTAAPSVPTEAKKPRDAQEELQRLASLREEGLITPDEFEEKRKAIVDTL